VDTSPTTSILHLKELIFAKTGISPCQLRLIFGGVELKDGDCLVDYDIVADSRIHSVLKIRGD
jgi:hypothetical protein